MKEKSVNNLGTMAFKNKSFHYKFYQKNLIFFNKFTFKCFHVAHVSLKIKIVIVSMAGTKKAASKKS